MVKGQLANQEFMDYESLNKILDYTPSSGLYDELMTKEKHVLETVNRVVNHSNQKQLEGEEFLNLSMHEHVRRFYATFYKIINDGLRANTREDLALIFWNAETIIYVGVFLVMVTMFAILVYVSM
jgi:hypothetical protein